MKTLLGFILKRPVTVIMFFITLVVLGITSLFFLPVDYLPPIRIPKVTVITNYEGLPAREVRDLITIPLEDSLSSLKGVKHISSISRDGLSLIELEFHWGTDLTMAGVETRENIDRAYISLPEGAEKPQVLPVDPSEEPVMVVGLFSESDDLGLLRRLGDRELKTAIQQLDAVGSVQVTGGRIDEIRIDADQSELAGRGLTLGDLSQTISSSNIDYPAGTITIGNLEYLIKTKGRVDNFSDLSRFYISNPSQTPVSVGDVADISLGYRDPNSFFQMDGREGVVLNIRKKGSSSPLTLSSQVREETARLETAYGGTIKFQILYDKADYVRQSLSGLTLSAVLGAFIAFFTLLFFTRKLKDSLILFISIPVSIMMALLLMTLTRIGLNTMSLGGLAIGIGMLVDNSVVVLENLSKKIKTPELSEIVGYTAEMAGSIIGSTLTSVIVFLPILFLPGLLGTIFRDLALSVIYSLSASLVVAITLVPVLFTVLGKNKDGTLSANNPLLLEKAYEKLATLAFRRFPLVLAAVVAPVILSFLFIPLMKKEFIKPANEGILVMEVTYPPGTDIAYLADAARAMTEDLRRYRFVEFVTCHAGGERNDPYYLADKDNKPEILHFNIMIRDSHNHGLPRLKKEIEGTFAVNDASFSLAYPENVLTEILGITDGRLYYLISGDDPDICKENLDRITSGFDSQMVQYSVNPDGEKPLIRIIPDRQALAKTGLDLANVAKTIVGSVYGSISTRVKINGYETDVRIRLAENQRNAFAKLGDIRILTQDRQAVMLKNLVTIKEETAVPYLLREDRKDIYRIGFAADSKNSIGDLTDNGFVSDDNISALSENLPAILLIFLMALALLYLLMGAQFESFFLPLLLMLSIPIGTGGIVLALLITGNSINLNSSMGALVLIGSTVNNSIILFETYRRNIESGMAPMTAVLSGSQERIRPIVITVLTTVLALIPMSIDPFGKSPQSGMAVAILGGLTVSTLFTVVIVPVLFYRYYLGRIKKP